MMSGSSWYSLADTQMRLKVDNPARMEPPIHVVFLRSGGAKILILMSLALDRFLTSFSNRSPKPGSAAARKSACVSGWG